MIIRSEQEIYRNIVLNGKFCIIWVCNWTYIGVDQADWVCFITQNVEFRLVLQPDITNYYFITVISITEIHICIHFIFACMLLAVSLIKLQ